MALLPSVLDAPTQPQLPSHSRVLVTGGSGFIGFHLGLRLRQEGHSVVALDDFNPYYSIALKNARAALLSAGGVEVVHGDLCDESMLGKLFIRNNFTHVAHLAGQAGVRYSLSSPHKYVRANLDCFVSLLETLRRWPGTPVAYASSSSVYGTPAQEIFSETDAVDAPESLYGATKRSSELFARVYHKLYKIPVTGLRFFSVYGPWGRPDMAYFSFTSAISQGLPIELYGQDTARDYTYVEDIVDGICRALAHRAEEDIFNLGGHRPQSLSRMVSLLETHLGLVANKTYRDSVPGDVQRTYANISRAAAVLGYVPKVEFPAHPTMLIRPQIQPGQSRPRSNQANPVPFRIILR